MNVDMASTKYGNDVRQLINIADIYGLHQLTKEPTRITDKSSALSDPDRQISGGGRSLKNFFRPLGPQFELKITGERAPSLDPPLSSRPTTFQSFINFLPIIYSCIVASLSNLNAIIDNFNLYRFCFFNLYFAVNGQPPPPPTREKYKYK